MYRHFVRLVLYVVFCMLCFNGCSSTLNISSKKSFANEDLLIMSFMEDIKHNDYPNASEKLSILFNKSNKPEYLAQKARIDAMYLNMKQESLDLLAKYIQSNPENLILLSTAFDIATFSKQYDLSIKYSKLILNLDHSEMSYINVANGYILSKQFGQAISYLERGYNFNHNELILNKMITLMYLYENHKETALSYLETHVRLYDFSEKIAQRLLAIYKENNNIDGLISVYKRLNYKYKKEEYSNILIQLYVLQDKKKELVSFLLKNTIDINTFMSLYRYIDNKSDGYNIAMELYKKSNNMNFLAQAAMMEYELSLSSESSHSIEGAISKLSKVVKVESNADYLNYLGYILIKHDSNLTEGIKYVKEALKSDPKSPYYLDSLAWGYYKLKKYDEAYKVMQEVVEKLGRHDKEVAFHLLSIEKEIKKNKKQKTKNKKQTK